jgi:hypothetical protein
VDPVKRSRRPYIGIALAVVIGVIMVVVVMMTQSLLQV